MSLINSFNPFGSNSRGRILGVISPVYLTSNRVHPTIDPSRFSRDLASDTPAARFKETHLVETLCTAASANVLRNLLPEQVQTLKASVPRCNGDERAILRMLKTWFDIFNAAFFGGGLKPLRENIRLGHDETREGHFHGCRGAVGRITIMLNIERDEYTGRIEHCYISTLLHEMLHAFLYYYTCECRACRTSFDASNGGAGPNGHGPAWANAMLGIGQGLQDIVDWPVDVGLQSSVRYDMTDAHWQATHEEAARWGIIPFMAMGGIKQGRYDPTRVLTLEAEAYRFQAERVAQRVQETHARRLRIATQAAQEEATRHLGRATRDRPAAPAQLQRQARNRRRRGETGAEANSQNRRAVAGETRAQEDRTRRERTQPEQPSNRQHQRQHQEEVEEARRARSRMPLNSAVSVYTADSISKTCWPVNAALATHQASSTTSPYPHPHPHPPPNSFGSTNIPIPIPPDREISLAQPPDSDSDSELSRQLAARLMLDDRAAIDAADQAMARHLAAAGEEQERLDFEEANEELIRRLMEGDGDGDEDDDGDGWMGVDC